MSSNDFQDRVKQAVEEYLQSQKLKYRWDEEDEQFELAVCASGCGVFAVIVRVDAEDNDPRVCKLFVLCAGLCIPPGANRGDIAQFLAGINYRSEIQGFTIDLTDGQVTFESLLFCYHGIVPPQSLIERYFDVTICEMRRATPLLVLLMQGDLTATDALQKFIGGRHE